MKKIVIIGAGPAGLTAAYELTKDKDYEVIMLEESSDIGGISRTVNHNGNRMDIGGHRFFSKNEAVMNWWRDVLPIQGDQSFDDKILGRNKKISQGGPDPEISDDVMLIRQRVSRIYYNHKFFDYPITMKAATFKNMGLATTLRAGFSYIASCFHKLPESNLENFYINRFGKVLYSMFFEGYTYKLWGRHPREISADWGAQRVKGLSIKTILKSIITKKNKETSLIEEFIYPKLGPGQLWEKTAARIKERGGSIIMNARVNKINCEGNIIRSVTYIKNNESIELEGDIFISTMPLKDLITGMGPIAPKDIQTIASGLPYRDFVTVGLLVDKLKIKNITKIKTLNNIVPDCWIYVQDTGVKLGRIQIFNNWSPYLVNSPESTVWIGLEYYCNENDDLWNMSESDIVKYASAELIKIGIVDENTEISDSHSEKVKKAYPAYFDTYSRIDELTAYINKFDNLYCIGRNGQHRYNNMDHSMMTAFKAVDSINGNDISKDDIWNVNTEQEYHEGA